MAFSDLMAAADRAVRGNLGGEAVVYQPEVGDAVTIEDAIFDERYVMLDQGNAGVEQVGPAVWLDLADLPVHPDEDEPVLTIRGVAYSVRERQPDGLDTVILLLHKVLA